MRMPDCIRKGITSVLFLIALSSCTKPCNQWEFQKIETGCPSFNAARISFFPEDECNGLELQIVRSSSGIRIYLNTFSLEVPLLPNTPDKALVKVTIGDLSFDVLADRFEGGQRFLLTPDIYDQLIEAFSMRIPVTITLWRYKTTISSKNFDVVWRRLNRVKVALEPV